MPAETISPPAALDPNASSASTPQTANTGSPEKAAPPASPAAPDPNGPAPAPTEPWSKSWLKEDGSFDHTAFDKAPDDLKPLAKQVGIYKTLDDFLKGFKEKEALLGKKGIVDPLPKDATEAQVNERMALLRKANGSPEKPEGYGLAKPEGLPAELWDQKLADTAAQLAHKHALSPAALKELTQLQITATQEQVKLQQQAEKNWYDSQDQLIKDYSIKEGMDYGKALDFAKRAGLRFGVHQDNPLFKNASFVLMAARIGRLLQEDKAVSGDVNDFSLAANMSPQAAQKEAEAIRTDKEHPLYSAYWNRDGKHKPDEVEKARSRARQLSQIAYAQRPVRGAR